MRAAAAQIKIDEYSSGIKDWGHRYEGQVNQGGKYHGQGVVSGASRFMPNGYRYEGEFRNNKKHGHGTMTNADGPVQSGQWKYGDFLG